MATTAQMKTAWEAFLWSPEEEASRSVRLRYLDQFLYLMLIYTEDQQLELPHFSDLQSVANLLARELLIDVNAICCQPNENDMESLQNYLATGRGAVLVTVLYTLGVEGLSCGQELADLLISLLPLYCKMPIHDGASKSASSQLDQGLGVSNTRWNELLDIPSSEPTIKFPALTEMSRTSYPSTQMKHLTHRFNTGQQARPSISDASSDGEEGESQTWRKTWHNREFLGEEAPRAFGQQGTYSEAKQHGYGSQSNVEREKVVPVDLTIKRSPLQLCMQVLGIVRQLASVRWQHNTLPRCIASSCVAPLVDLLEVLHQDLVEGEEDEAESWPQQDVWSLLHEAVVTIISVMSDSCLQPGGLEGLIASGAASSLLNVARACCHQAGETYEDSFLDGNYARFLQLRLAAEVSGGIWSLLQSVFSRMPRNPSMLNMAIKFLEDVISGGGLSLLQEVLQQCELFASKLSPAEEEYKESGRKRNGDSSVMQWVKIQVVSLVDSITQAIKSIKRAKVNYIHNMKCSHRKHRRCDFSHFEHHHHDVLGTVSPGFPECLLTISESYGSTEHLKTDIPSYTQFECLIARLGSFMLKLLGICKWNTARSCILACVADAGLCCCMNPSTVVSQMLLNLVEQSPAMCNYTLSVLTRTLLRNCSGSASKPNQSSFCNNCQNLDGEDNSHALHGLLNKDISLPARGSLLDASDSALSGSDASLSSDTAESPPRWHCVQQLLFYLCSSNESLSLIVGKHMLDLVAQANGSLKQELFCCLVQPVLQATQDKCSPKSPKNASSQNEKLCISDSVIQYCLSSLPVLLSVQTCLSMFVRSGGVRLLSQLVEAPVLRQTALLVFEKLVQMEIQQKSYELLLGTSVEQTLHSRHNSQKDNITCTSTARNREAASSPDIHSSHQADESMGTRIPCVAEAFAQVVLKAHHGVDCFPEDCEQLSRLGDFWTSCSHVFPMNEVFRLCFTKQGGVQDAEYLAVTSLKRVCSTLESDNSSRTMLNLRLSLVEAALSITLEAYCGDERNKDQKLRLLENIWKVLEERVLPSGIVQAVCDMMLRVSVQTSSQTQPDPHVISIQHLKIADTEDRETTNWNDLCDSDATCDSQKGYDADSEMSAEEIISVADVQPRWWIKWPELCRVLVRLLSAHYGEPGMSGVCCHILLRLVTLAKESTQAAQALYTERLVILLLEGFQSVLTSSQLHCKVERQLILDLILLLLGRDVSALELTQFLALFKEKTSPVEELLGATIALVDRYDVRPRHILTFPVSNDGKATKPVHKTNRDLAHMVDRHGQVSPRSNVYSEYMQLLDTSSVQEALELNETDSSPSKMSSSFLHLERSSPSSLSIHQLGLKNSCRPSGKKAISVSMWVRLELGKAPTGQKLTDSDTYPQYIPSNAGSYTQLPWGLQVALKQTVSAICWSPTNLHIFSLGDAQLQLQLWLDKVTGGLVVRLVQGTEQPKVLAEGGWHHLLATGMWHHLVLVYLQKDSLSPGNSQAKVSVAVDGCFQKILVLELKEPQRLTSEGRQGEETMLYVGHTYSPFVSQSMITACSLANLMVFEDMEMTHHQCFHLFCLGPECASLSLCDSSELTTDYALHVSQSTLRHCGMHVQVLAGSQDPKQILMEMSNKLLVAYSGGHSGTFLQFGPGRSDSAVAGMSHSSKFLPFSQQPKVHACDGNTNLYPAYHGFNLAVSEIGGIGIFLFLFAQVVEQHEDELIQSQALNLLFTYMKRHAGHTHEFANANGYAMLARVLTSDRCIVGYRILKVLLDGAVTGSVVYFNKCTKCYEIIPNHSALIRDVKVLTDLLLAWHVWDKTPTQVWELGFQALESLVQEGHPHRMYNIYLLRNAAVPRKLILIFLERIQEARPSLAVPLSRHVVGVMRALLVSLPMDKGLVQHVWDMLLLLHPAASTFINHAVKDYYFYLRWTGVESLKLDQTGPRDAASNLPAGAAPNLPAGAASNLPSGAAPNLQISAAPNLQISAATNLPAGAAPNLQISAAPNLPSGAAPNLPSGAAPNLPSGAAPNLPSGAAPNLPSGAAPNLQISTAPNLQISAAPNLPSGAAPNLPSGAAPNLPAGAAPNLPSGAAPDLPSGAASNLLSGAAPNLPAGAAPNLPAGAAPNLPSGAAPNLPSGAAPNLPSGAAPNLPSGAAPNLPSGAAPNLPAGTAPNLPSGAAPNLPSGAAPNLPSYISTDAAPNVAQDKDILCTEDVELFSPDAHGAEFVAPNRTSTAVSTDPTGPPRFHLPQSSSSEGSDKDWQSLTEEDVNLPSVELAENSSSSLEHDPTTGESNEDKILDFASLQTEGRSSSSASQEKVQHNIDKEEVADSPSMRIEDQMFFAASRFDTRSTNLSVADDDPGLVALCSGLLDLLSEVVETATAECSRLFGSIMQPRNLLVMAHHGASEVRKSVVGLLAAYWRRTTPELCQKFLDFQGFSLLACQLHQHTTTLPLVEASLTLLLGQHCNLELGGLSAIAVSGLQGELRSVVCLLSLVERSLASPAITTTLFSVLKQHNKQLAKVMLDAGLVEVLANTVYTLANCDKNAAATETDGHAQRSHSPMASLWSSIKDFFTIVIVTIFSGNGVVYQQSLEDCFTTLHSLQQALAQRYGGLSDAVEHVSEIRCNMFQAILDHITTQHQPLAGQKRSFSIKVGEVIAKIQGLSRPATFPSLNEPSRHASPYMMRGSTNLPSSSTTWYDSRSSTVSSSPVRQQSNLTQRELLERFKWVLTQAVDTALFREHSVNILWKSVVSDPKTPAQTLPELSHRKFSLYLLQFLISALALVTEQGLFGRQSPSNVLMWQAKDMVRLQFSRLLPGLLAPEQPLTQRLYTLEFLANHNKCSEMLKLTLRIGGMPMGQRLVIYLHDLINKHLTELSTAHQDEVDELHCLLQNNGFTPVKPGTRLTPQLKETLLQEKSMWRQEFVKEYSVWLTKLEGTKLRLLGKLHAQAKSLTAKAMEVTQVVVNTQNRHRRHFIDHLKSQLSVGLQVKKDWQQLIHQLTHKRAIWHRPKVYPQFWQLDSTEGPCRVRRRLQRCHLVIEPRFLVEKCSSKLDAEKLDPPLGFLFEDEAQPSDSAALIYRLHTNEKIQYTSRCISVTPSTETPGELLLGEESTFFVADKAIQDSSYTQVLLGNKDHLSLTLPHEDIKELQRRWYQLQDNALEVFLSNGKTFLLAFPSTKDRDQVFGCLQQHPLPGLVPGENLGAVMQLWQDGRITNFEYLTHLNKIAGRSFNDLMQYPIFPFVLAKYQSNTLNLYDATSYRNLAKPIAVQDKSREHRYIDNYKWLESERRRQMGMEDREAEYQPEPYHYGSHYSNSGTVLHFLVRLPPFTQMFLHYQDQNFDLPDRTFHSMQTAWRLASFESTTDVKELIPEFFFLPEFLTNSEGFDFGVRQDGEVVWDVLLPPWSEQDPRLFILIHRQVLESDYVTEHLPSWIDLVFGFKQKGKAAVDAVNVFHPATYFGIDVASIRDPLRRTAIETMIKTYGQTPKQLFKWPHPGPLSSGRRMSAVKERTVMSQSVLDTRSEPVAVRGVHGLRWGLFLGSPDYPEPVVAWQQLYDSSVAQLVALPTGQIFGLAPNACLLIMYSKERGITAVNSIDVEWAAIVSWGYRDNILRIRNRKHAPAINLLHWTPSEDLTCCVAVPDCRRLFLGGSSGVISHFSTCKSDKAGDLQILGSRRCLFGHSGAVTALVVCNPFSVLVSASEDCTILIWDLNRLSYVRSITCHTAPVSVLAVSDTLGDIASVSHTGPERSCLLLHTINGQMVASYSCDTKILSLIYSTASEGRSINVVAGGLHNGIVRLWNSWTLEPLRDITANNLTKPIISVTFSYDNTRLYASTEDALVTMWAHSATSRQRHPNFIPFL